MRRCSSMYKFAYMFIRVNIKIKKKKINDYKKTMALKKKNQLVDRHKNNFDYLITIPITIKELNICKSLIEKYFQIICKKCC